MRASLRILCSESMFANTAKYPSLKNRVCCVETGPILRPFLQYGSSRGYTGNAQPAISTKAPEDLTMRERAIVYHRTMDDMLVPSGNWQETYTQNRSKYMANLLISAVAFAGAVFLFRSCQFVVRPDLTVPVNIDQVYKARLANRVQEED